MQRLAILDTTGKDVSYALRSMRKNPVFAATAILTLAVGIGGNTAMFTVVRAVLLKPLAYPNPEQVVQLSVGSTDTRFEEMRNAARSYEALGDYLGSVFDVTLSGDTGPEVLKGVSISANFLNILGVNPLLGRGFRAEEELASGPRVAMISAGLWNRRFGGGPGILGKTVMLAAIPYSIVGVLPPGFAFPYPDVDVWITRPSQFVNATSPLLRVFGRLKAGTGMEQANAELTVLNQRYRTAHPGMLDGNPNAREQVRPVRDQLVANVRSLLWMLFGAVGLVLMIVCANLASLLLARAAFRSREFAIRAAVGASRSRLVRQLLAESIVLAFAGGGLGVLSARWILLGTAHWRALDLPRAGEIRVDGVVLAFAVLLSIATGLLFGLLPSLGASRPDLAAVLRAGGAAAGSAARKRMAGTSARGALVIGQIALSTVLLISAALLMQSLVRIYGVDPGFDPQNLLTLHVSLPGSRYDTSRKQAAFFDELVRRVQALPGVRSAAAAFTVPMNAFPMTPVQLANQPARPLNQRRLAAIQHVTTAYFDTLGIPLRRGRKFSERDSAAAPPTAVINESLARLLWPSYPAGLDPVGQSILIGARPEPVEVVGIVADTHQYLETNPAPGIFRPFDQYPLVSAAFVVRTAGDPLGYVRAVSDQARAIDPDQPISTARSMEDLIEAAEGQRRLVLLLLGCFAGVALLLAVIGIYGVISYSVANRRQEVGIRRALGAQDSDILWLVVRQGLSLTIAGIALGVGGALATTRLMASLLFHTSAVDTATFVEVAVVFLLAAMSASYIPARRTARLDPAVALRVE